MAVWHHNVEGGPNASDYMDIDSVYRMIGCGFGLGLHGHQHRSDIGQRVIHIPVQEPMLVVSAGSLGAGPRDLPAGVNRQYNVIELDDTFAKARVHVREIAMSSVFGPARRTELGGHSYVDFELRKPAHTTSSDGRQVTAVQDAERCMVGRDYSGAVSALEGWSVDGGYPRALMVDALSKGRLWDRAASLLHQPTTIAELVLLVDALCHMKQFDTADDVLASAAGPLGVADPQRTELRRQIATKRTLNQ